MSRRLLGVALIFAAGVGLFFLFNSLPHGNRRPEVAPSPPAAVAKAGPAAAQASVAAPTPPPGQDQTAALTATSVTATAKAPVPVATAPEFTALPALTVLENMRMAVRQYGLMFGGNPVGTNPEITRALNGDNPKQAKFLQPDAGLRVNDKGELVDPWGTPFFFHQLSAMEMEIRSAGPDKVMWTADDLVTK